MSLLYFNIKKKKTRNLFNIYKKLKWVENNQNLSSQEKETYLCICARVKDKSKYKNHVLRKHYLMECNQDKRIN